MITPRLRTSLRRYATRLYRRAARLAVTPSATPRPDRDADARLRALADRDDRHPVVDILAAYPSRPIVIDVSRHQGQIDWHRVAACGVSGAIIKATEGRTYQDPRALENLRGARAAGLDVGSYHYCHLAWQGAQTDPIPQMDNWLGEVERAGGDPCDGLGMWLDLETREVAELCDLNGARATVDWIARASDYVLDQTGQRPGLYLSRRAITEVLGDEQGERLMAHRCWWARYPRMPFPLSERHEPSMHLAGWSWWGWQFSCRGIVPGIRGDVDLNLINQDHND